MNPRILDMLVAEYVFGWQWRQDAAGNEAPWGKGYRYLVDPAKIQELLNAFDDESWIYAPANMNRPIIIMGNIPPYTTRVVWAETIVEHVKANGGVITILTGSHHNRKNYECAMTTKEAHVFVGGDTMAYAIVNAALELYQVKLNAVDIDRIHIFV